MPAVIESSTERIAEEKSFVEDLGAKFDAGIDPTKEVKEPAKAEKEEPKATEPKKATPAKATLPEKGEPEPEPITEEVIPEVTTDEDEPEVLEDDEEIEPTTDELAEEARAELVKHGLKMTMDDVPKEYRPLVKAKIDNAEIAVQRALNGARAYRKEEAQYRAARAFDEQRPALRVMELLHDKDGKLNEELYEQVNALMAEMETPSGKKLFVKDVRDERLAIQQAIEAQRTVIEQTESRGSEMVTYVARACARLGLPFMSTSKLVAAEVALREHPEQGLTDREIDAILGDVLRDRKKDLGEKKAADKKDAIRGRTLDKKTTTPAGKGGSGAPAPAKKPMPKNDEEFTADFVSRQRVG